MALTASDIREYAKDKPELNILLEGQLQSDDPQVDLAIRLAVSDFNSFPPVTKYPVEAFPNDAILLYGALHHLAMGEVERQLRNQVNYNAQGLSTNLDDKFPQYQQLAQYYWQLFSQKAQQFKRYLNMEDAWGQMPSPYAGINEFRFSG